MTLEQVAARLAELVELELAGGPFAEAELLRARAITPYGLRPAFVVELAGARFRVILDRVTDERPA